MSASGLGYYSTSLHVEKVSEPKVVPEAEWSSEERMFMAFAGEIFRNFGFDNFVLADMNGASGAFRAPVVIGGGKILLNRDVARDMMRVSEEGSILHEPTDTILHELAHLIEHHFKKLVQGDKFWALGQAYSHASEGDFWSMAFGLDAVVTLAHLGSLAEKGITLSKRFKDAASREPGVSSPGESAMSVDGTKKDDDAMAGENNITGHPIIADASRSPGGIDLTNKRLPLETRGDGNVSGFSFKNPDGTPTDFEGIRPVIISIQPATDLPEFLGIK
jgi:hypothetical protein